MKITSVLFLLILLSQTSTAQPPARPLLPFNVYSLTEYHAVDPADTLQLPADLEYDRVSSVAFTPEGTLLVLNRGKYAFFEFDQQGHFIRAFGDELELEFAHGLNIDADGNLWITDLFKHQVHKLDADGNVLMTLGSAGESGEWNEAANSRLFYQPNETALDSQGNIYVAQGHGISFEGDTNIPMVLKFSRNGTFIKQWGGLGTEPGKFAVAHSIKIDTQDNIYVADRENQRIQIFNTEGEFQNQWTYSAMVCAITLHDDGYLYLTSGFDGQFAKVDMTDGSMIGALGKPGNGIGEFGEAHFLTLDSEENIYIADVRNRRVQVYAKAGN